MRPPLFADSGRFIKNKGGKLQPTHPSQSFFYATTIKKKVGGYGNTQRFFTSLVWGREEEEEEKLEKPERIETKVGMNSYDLSIILHLVTISVHPFTMGCNLRERERCQNRIL